MNEQELKELMDKVGAETANKINDAIKELGNKNDAFKAEIKAQYEEQLKLRTEGLLTMEKAEEYTAKMNALVDSIDESETLKTLKNELDEVKMELNALKEEDKSGAPAKKESLYKQLMDAFESTGRLKEVEADNGTKTKAFDLPAGGQHTFKAAIDMTTALALTPGTDPGVNIGYLTDYSRRDVQIDLTKDTHLMQVFPVTPTTQKYHGVVVEYDYEDGAAVTAENTSAAKSSFKFKTLEFKVFDIPTIFHVSKNNLQDIPSMLQRIARVAPDRIMSRIDIETLNSTGDNDTNIKGMRVSGNFTAFDATEYENEVQAANIIDLISKMKLQAEEADQDVNVVVMHPSLVSRAAELKDADNNSISDRRLTFGANGELLRIAGLTVVKNKKLPKTQLFVVYTEYNEYGLRQDVEITIGMENADLSKRMRTILFEVRVAFGVGKPEANYYEDDIDAAIAILNNDEV